MQTDVEKWLNARGYNAKNDENGLSVSDNSGKTFTLDTTGFSKKDGMYLASPDSIRSSLSQSGIGAPKGYTPLRNTLSGQGVSVGYDSRSDAPIVGGQPLNKNDARLIKIGEDYWIDENYAKSFVPKTYENPYKKEIHNLITELTDSEFIYNPERDGALAAAQQEAMLKAKQSANSRGLLGGSTAEIMRQKAAQELVPQYEQMAYARYAADRAAKQETLSLLSGLAENAFSEYKDTQTLQQNAKKFAFDVQTAADTAAYRAESLLNEKEENQQNQAAKTFANQLSKVIAMGEVDNDAAEILGIPAGTLTAAERQFMAKLYEAQEADRAERAQKAAEAEAQLAKEEREWQRKKELLSLQTDENIREYMAKQ